MTSTPHRLAPLPGYAERQLVIPKGSVLTDAEVTALLTQADEAKRRGESGITTAAPDPEDGYQIRVPRSAALTRDEAVVILSRANEAKEYRHADLLVTFAEGALVKNWLTLKNQGLSSSPGPWLGGRQIREF